LLYSQNESQRFALKVVRAAFLICIIVGFAALFYVLGPSRRPLGSGEDRVGIETEEDILVEGIRFSEWEEDRLVWRMAAERARYHHKEKRASLEQVGVTFFPATGGKMLLWANLVDYDVRTKGLRACDSVRGKSDQGYDFTTESLFYDGTKREVTTDDKVTLEKDRLTIQGTGMQGSLVDHKFRLLSQVRAVFSPQGIVPRGADGE
jgi:LPS export ABC transporter protein LptC